jgi:hypothetical protein
MNHWVAVRGGISFFEDEQWERIFAERKPRDYDKSWVNQMVHDLKWVLKHKTLGGASKQRNTYWDDFVPSEKETFEVKQYLKC